jgi:hypothetical protein
VLPAAPTPTRAALAGGQQDGAAIAEDAAPAAPTDQVHVAHGPPVVPRRRTWEEMDALRAQMLRHGYPLAELRSAENERVWSSLVQRRRIPQVLKLLGWSEGELQAAIQRARTQHGQHRAQQRARTRRYKSQQEKAEEP